MISMINGCDCGFKWRIEEPISRAVFCTLYSKVDIYYRCAKCGKRSEYHSDTRSDEDAKASKHDEMS